MASALVVLVSSAGRSAADDVMARSRAMYAALQSYADVGTVTYEFGVSGKDKHTFSTLFRRTPRRLLLDFRKQGGDRYVVWGDPDAFHTWWKATGQQSDHPNPNNVPALNGSGQNTYGVGLKVPTLIYAKAQLLSDFANFTDRTAEGAEVVVGRSCHRVVGTASDVYGATSKEVNVRKMTVWIDADSLLIRKVLEEWKSIPGQISRITTVYEPQANPTIEESRFRFLPPTLK
jgi:hypothetical protein